jgi:hypothetical protein
MQICGTAARHKILALAMALAVLMSASAGAPIYSQPFDGAAALGDFVYSDPAVWEHREGALELLRNSDYNPPHRSPLNIALLADRQYGSFTLEADLLSTSKEYDHRSMCLFFNFQDPARYYYLHISTKTDDHAHNIFIVNEAPRTKISTSTTAGHAWGENQWHKVRLVRDVESGLIELFINNEKVMEARDKTFTAGHIGVGSFDDPGRIDNIRIIGQPLSTARTGFFHRR